MNRNILYSILIGLVFFTPFVYSGDLYNGLISAKQIWFYGVMSLLIVINGTDRLFNRNKCFSALNIIDISLLAFYLYFFLRSLFTSDTPLIYNQKFLIYSLLTLFYFIVKNISDRWYSKESDNIITNRQIKNTFHDPLLIGLMITGFAEAALGIMQMNGYRSSFHTGYKITGTFFNPAPYALYLAALFPLALSAGLNELKKDGKALIRIVSLLTLVSILIVLPATMNRASWIGAAAGAVFAVNQKYRLTFKTVAMLKTGILKLTALAAILMILLPVIAGLYHFKAGSSTGRLFIWEVTTGKIAGKPIFGYGVGRFEADYNNWQAEYFKKHPQEMEGIKGMAAGNTKYCFNEYLETAAEQGSIGLFLFLALIASVFWGIKKEAAFAPDRNEGSNTGSGTRLSAPILIPSFISLIVCAFISIPFYSLPTLILFFFLSALISSEVKESTVVKRGSAFPIHWRMLNVALAVILLTGSVLLFNLAIKQYKAYKNWGRAEALFKTGKYKAANAVFSENEHLLPFTGTYLQYYGKSLYLDKNYLQSAEMLERASRYTSDDLLYTSLGDAYKSLNRYSEAENAYQHALFMVPHLLYPGYLLANLYAETGQKEKALNMAHNLMDKKIKIESAAVKEIRNKMQELIIKLGNQ